jgi:hypothetical protein
MAPLRTCWHRSTPSGAAPRRMAPLRAPLICARPRRAGPPPSHTTRALHQPALLGLKGAPDTYAELFGPLIAHLGCQDTTLPISLHLHHKRTYTPWKRGRHSTRRGRAPAVPVARPLGWRRHCWQAAGRFQCTRLPRHCPSTELSRPAPAAAAWVRTPARRARPAALAPAVRAGPKAPWPGPALRRISLCRQKAAASTHPTQSCLSLASVLGVSLEGPLHTAAWPSRRRKVCRPSGGARLHTHSCVQATTAPRTAAWPHTTTTACQERQGSGSRCFLTRRRELPACRQIGSSALRFRTPYGRGKQYLRGRRRLIIHVVLKSTCVLRRYSK